jgi:hypothetical protein
MESFNVVSTTSVVRVIPLLKEASPVKVACYTLVAPSNLEKALDTTKETTRGAGGPSTKMGGRPTNIDGWPTWELAIRPPLRLADLLLCARAPRVLVGVEYDLLVHFPPIQPSERSTGRSLPLARRQKSSLQGRWPFDAVWRSTSAAAMTTSHW